MSDADKLRQVEAERDEAQEACRAWKGVYETLEAHLQDRVAMNDLASPETYLSILRSSVARVERDSEQLLKARWSREAESARVSDEADRLRAALEDIVQWADAYPLDRFPEPDFKQAEKVLSDAGMSLDAISASNMRHAIEGAGRIARGALDNS